MKQIKKHPVMKSIFVLLALITNCAYTFSQHITISGFVRDAISQEVVVGARVYLPEYQIGAITNSSGYFTFIASSNDKNTMLTVNFVGYETYQNSIAMNRDIRLNVNLIVKTKDEVEIIAKDPMRMPNPEIGVLRMPVEQLRNIPNLGGEPDVIKAFQLMPGVSGGSEGTSGLFVRGGTPDQNLFLLDNVPLYYVNHVGGFISTFDPNAINDVKLYKGGFPAQYAGRLSSVVDITAKDGNTNAKKGEFSLGLLTMKFQIDGPFKKDSSLTYFFSARRFNFDLITRPLGNIVNRFQGTAGYTFYDINGKLTKRFSDGSKLSLTVYEGRDNFFFNGRSTKNTSPDVRYRFNSNVRWGNFMTTLNYSKPVTSKLFANINLATTNFKYVTDVRTRFSDPNETALKNQSRIKFTSGISDIILNTNFDYLVNKKYSIAFGMTNTYHIFTPGRIDYENPFMQDTVYGEKRTHAYENNMFIENRYKLNDKIFFNAGLNFTSFVLSDTAFFSLQPRLTFTIQLKNDLTLQGGYSRMVQNIHNLTSAGVGFTADLWIPVSRNLIPEKSNQFNLGLTYSLRNRKFPLNFVLEGFYKDMNNLIDYKEGTNIFMGSDIEQKVIAGGLGEVYGVELFVQKSVGKLTGWFGYTWSKNMRQFDEINNGTPFPFVFDRRHDISIVGSYQINEKIQLTASWVYSTGNAITLVQSQYNVADINYVPAYFVGEEFYFFNNAHYYDGKNSTRMPAFHKLDIGFNFKKEKSKGVRTWFVGVYNVYNRQNPFFLFYKENNQGVNSLHQLTMFPIIPSFNYSFAFDRGRNVRK